MGIQVANLANVIQISDGAGTTNFSSIQKSLIISVGTYFQKNCVNGLGNSPYAYGKRTPGRTTKTIIRITCEGEINYDIEVDEVLNQPTWQGCTQAALINAYNDIVSWL